MILKINRFLFSLKKLLAVPGRKQIQVVFVSLVMYLSEDYKYQLLDFKENFHSGVMTQM